MMINGQAIGLKGQLILAQGKRSVALGWKMGVKIVRVITFFERLSLLRTKNMYPNSVRKKIFTLIIVPARTGFQLFLLPQTLSGARISWPFRPKKVSYAILVF